MSNTFCFVIITDFFDTILTTMFKALLFPHPLQKVIFYDLKITTEKSFLTSVRIPKVLRRKFSFVSYKWMFLLVFV